MNQTVAILPGIFSGRQTTRRLRELLKRAGYEVIEHAAEADTLLAHSAGPLWLPRASAKQKIVLIDPPYWPGKTIRERARERGRSNFRFHERGVPLRAWLVRQLWGIYYALRNPLRTRYVLRHMADFNLLHAIRNHNVVLVRNEHDEWLTPDFTDLRRAHPNLAIIELPGDHDGFNYHPERYVNLLQSMS